MKGFPIQRRIVTNANSVTTSKAAGKVGIEGVIDEKDLELRYNQDSQEPPPLNSGLPKNITILSVHNADDTSRLAAELRKTKGVIAEVFEFSGPQLIDTYIDMAKEAFRDGKTKASPRRKGR